MSDCAHNSNITINRHEFFMLFVLPTRYQWMQPAKAIEIKSRNKKTEIKNNRQLFEARNSQNAIATDETSTAFGKFSQGYYVSVSMSTSPTLLLLPFNSTILKQNKKIKHIARRERACAHTCSLSLSFHWLPECLGILSARRTHLHSKIKRKKE